MFVGALKMEESRQICTFKKPNFDQTEKRTREIRDM